jgi:aconitase A
MARGWGRSEEDLGAEKQQAQEEAARPTARLTREQREEAARRRGIELSLARVEQMLAVTESPARRQALEAARADLRRQLAPKETGPR